MIKAEHISKKIGETTILRDISYHIEEGDYIAIMGPSGSGKSTLLYSFSGMDSINEGQILFDGKNLTQMTEEELSALRLTTMGFVFQNAQMLKNLSILDNIILSGLVAGKEEPAVIRKRAVDYMKRMGIEGLADRDIREVSGGQLQRASICRAMINCPKVLFMDEPTGALNSEATAEVLKIIQELNTEGMTIVLVTHDTNVARSAHKVVYIKDGEVDSVSES